MSRHRTRKLTLSERVNLNPDISRGLLALLIFILGGLSALSFFSLAGVAGEFISSLLSVAFGQVRYVFPIILILLAILMVKDLEYEYRPTHWIGSIIFLLVFNALVHQYLIPGVQLGSKIRANDEGKLIDIMSANRPVRPGYGCLWCNQLIDTTALAKEAKTDEERKNQAYGVQEPNPSVISLNAISASHAVNDFLLDYLGLRAEPDLFHYEHFHFLKDVRKIVQPRKDEDCSECSHTGQRYARGSSVELPCIEG